MTNLTGKNMTFNVKCCERLKGDADTLGKLATGNGLELGYFIGCLHNGDWKAEKARGTDISRGRKKCGGGKG